MTHEEIIVDYLKDAYSVAKAAGDTKMMIRLVRAMIAFNYNNFDKEVTWDDMVTEYFAF
jgi:hypothetical protein